MSKPILFYSGDKLLAKPFNKVDEVLIGIEPGKTVDGVKQTDTFYGMVYWDNGRVGSLINSNDWGTVFKTRAEILNAIGYYG